MNQNLASLLSNLKKEDAILLTRNDAWLEGQRMSLAQEINSLCTELNSILHAQKIKSELRASQSAAVVCAELNSCGEYSDIVVKITNTSTINLESEPPFYVPSSRN